MKFVKNRYIALVLMATLCSFWSCDEDKNQLSEAVLASASALNFEVTGASEKTITVYADADWVAEIPDWVTISPSSGTGTMDVTISVSDNLRDGTPDNPRKAALVFKGRTLASEAKVTIEQKGDKYRDVKEYTLDKIAELKDETIVSIPNVIVMAVTKEGYVVTDAAQTSNIYVLTKSTASIGDKISLKGVKSTDTQSLVIVDSDSQELVSAGGVVTYPTAKDITSIIDSYESSSREFISVTGILKGNNLSVEGAKYSISITDAPEALGIAALNGHRIVVKGYFAGLAAPVIKILVTEIEDKGVAKTIYFAENFEWLDPWSVVGGAGETVASDDLAAGAPQILTPKIDEVSALDALLQKGYEFLRVTTKTPGECIYLQRNYLKFGKTSYQAGIVLPKLVNIPSDVSLELSFDWCPMRQGAAKIDPVNLIIIVANGDDEMTFNIPPSGFPDGQKLKWIKAEVQLTGAIVTKDTKITIRQTEWPLATANRWFLDNIEITKVE